MEAKRNAKPWLSHYPEGVRAEIDVERFHSVPEIINQSLQKYADAPAFENMGKSMTYKEVDQLSIQFAAYLQGLGLQPGDRVAIQMPNLLQYPVALFGVMRAGLIAVNTNPLYTAREMQHQFKDSGARAIIILANFADKLEKVLPNTQIEHVIVTEIGDLFGGFKKLITNFVVKRVKKMVPDYNLPRAVSFNNALQEGSNLPYVPYTAKRDDPCVLQYTGGTTGVSKGATLTHGNLIANLLQVAEYHKNLLRERQEIFITALPLYHIFAFTCNCMLGTYFGAKNILITNPRDIPGFVKELKKHPYTFITGVNTLFNALLNNEEFRQLNFSHLRIAFGGGMAVQRPVSDRWEQLTGSPIVEGYGLSETAPVLTSNPGDGSARIGTIGMPVPNTEVAIFDEEGNPLATGEIGEICAKGPQVMLGYWNRDEDTRSTFWDDGWFRTGDIGMMDEDGFFQIVDRKKDMILVSGFNVYPNEVEEVIAGHAKVAEVACIGVPDDKSTEAVKAVIVCKDSSLTIDEVRQFCKNELAGYKVPKHVEFVDELPKTNVGKILRRALREREEAKTKVDA